MKEKYLKNMKTDSKILIIIAIILMAISFFTVYFSKTPENVAKTDTITISDTVWKLDSVKIIKPIQKYVEKVKIDTVYNDNGDTIQLITENKKYQDTITTCAGDTMAVTSYISGINATLDSLKVNLSKQEIIKTEIITKYITPKKKFIDHFKVGPSITAGYDLTNRQWGVMAGVSVTYNF